MIATSSGNTPSTTIPPRMGAKTIMLEGGGRGTADFVAKDTTHWRERLSVITSMTTPYTEAAANPTSPTKVRLSANRVTKGVL